MVVFLVIPNYDGSSESYEKMKNDLIEQGFDLDKGWFLLPFVGAFQMMFDNKNGQKGFDNNGR